MSGSDHAHFRRLTEEVLARRDACLAYASEIRRLIKELSRMTVARNVLATRNAVLAEQNSELRAKARRASP